MSTGPTARLVTPVSPDEPPGLDDGSAAAVLDEAEDIINSIGPEMLADVAGQTSEEGLEALPAQARASCRVARPAPAVAARISALGDGRIPRSSTPARDAGDSTVVPAFTVDRARALGGPSWLVERRVAAAERVAAGAWPTTEEEIWRYSRIDELDLEAFEPGGLHSTVEGADGLLIDAGAPAASDLVGSVMADAVDVFAELNSAFVTEPLLLSVPAGKAVIEPVVITHHVGEEGAAAFPRLVIDAGPDSEITVVERFTSAADVRALVAPVLELRAEQAARVRYLAVNELGHRGVADRQPGGGGERDSTTVMGAVALGADYARVRTDNVLAGQGASARQIAVFFAEADQMHDFRTIQTHRGSPHHQRPAVQGRGRRAVAAASTPASSRSATRPGGPTPSRPTATSS